MSDRSRPEGLVEIHTSRPADRSVIAPERDVRTGRQIDFDRSDKGREPSEAVRPGSSGAPSPARLLGRLPAVSGRAARASWTIPAVVTGLVLAVVVGFVAVANSRGGDDATVATPSQSAGGAAAPSAGIPGGSAATASGATTAGATAPALDPALDPARIYGYRVTSTVTLYEPAGPGGRQVGSIDRTFLRCPAGTCKFGGWTFTAASPDISQTHVGPAGSPCEPVTRALAIVRAPDGTYTGTMSQTPAAVRARGCVYIKTADALRLEPVIKLAADTPPDLSLPAGLDPVRISKYQGTSSAGGKTTAVTVACEGGVCQLRCFPVCASPVVVQAAAGTWSQAGIPTSGICPGGTTSLTLLRSADGSYTGKATTTYVGKPGPGCATSTSFSLQPVTG